MTPKPVVRKPGSMPRIFMGVCYGWIIDSKLYQNLGFREWIGLATLQPETSSEIFTKIMRLEFSIGMQFKAQSGQYVDVRGICNAEMRPILEFKDVLFNDGSDAHRTLTSPLTFIRGVNHFLVTHRTTWMDDACCAGIDYDIRPSRNGKNASDATAEPQAQTRVLGFDGNDAGRSMRLIWPAPPKVMPLPQNTIAFDFTYLTTRHANISQPFVCGVGCNLLTTRTSAGKDVFGVWCLY